MFVIQVANAPFGISWYQGDLDSNGHGNGEGAFIGRFSIEHNADVQALSTRTFGNQTGPLRQIQP